MFAQGAHQVLVTAVEISCVYSFDNYFDILLSVINSRL